MLVFIPLYSCGFQNCPKDRTGMSKAKKNIFFIIELLIFQLVFSFYITVKKYSQSVDVAGESIFATIMVPTGIIPPSGINKVVEASEAE